MPRQLKFSFPPQSSDLPSFSMLVVNFFTVTSFCPEEGVGWAGRGTWLRKTGKVHTAPFSVHKKGLGEAGSTTVQTPVMIVGEGSSAASTTAGRSSQAQAGLATPSSPALHSAFFNQVSKTPIFTRTETGGLLWTLQGVVVKAADDRLEGSESGECQDRAPESQRGNGRES